MRAKQTLPLSLLSLSLSLLLLHHHQSLAQNTTGYTCAANQSTATYPCQAYAFYRASFPSYLDLGSIGDLFQVSRLQISKTNNIAFPNATLVPGQPLLIPLTCSCNPVTVNLTATARPNSSSIAYAKITYYVAGGDTFYAVSTYSFQNLTTYQSVEVVNPELVPQNLTIGVTTIFPVFCKCPNGTQLGNRVTYLISYVVQPEDDVASVATLFGSTVEDITAVNGIGFDPFSTVFVPVSRLPVLAQLHYSFRLSCTESPFD